MCIQYICVMYYLCKYVLGIILCGKQYYATNTDENINILLKYFSIWRFINYFALITDKTRHRSYNYISLINYICIIYILGINFLFGKLYYATNAVQTLR